MNKIKIVQEELSFKRRASTLNEGEMRSLNQSMVGKFDWHHSNRNLEQQEVTAKEYPSPRNILVPFKRCQFVDRAGLREGW